MQQDRGILYIPDPRGGANLPSPAGHTKEITLVFNENERYLYQAQAALWELRRKCGWICVCAEGSSSAAAIALAAQLPVDRLALAAPELFSSADHGISRQASRLRAFARRNLSLVVAQILLADTDESQLRSMMRASGRRDICITGKLDRDMLTAPWKQLLEKNLLNPWKCV